MICKLRGDDLVDRATIFCDRSRARTSLPEDSVQGNRMIFPLAFTDIPVIFHSLRGQKHSVLESTIGIPSFPTPTCLKPGFQILGS